MRRRWSLLTSAATDRKVPRRDRLGLFGSVCAIESKWSTGRSCIDYLEFKGAGDAIG